MVQNGQNAVMNVVTHKKTVGGVRVQTHPLTNLEGCGFLVRVRGSCGDIFPRTPGSGIDYKITSTFELEDYNHF